MSESVLYADMEVLINLWIFDCEYRGLSPKTIKRYRLMSGHLLWWCKEFKVESLTKVQMQRFLLYVREGDAKGELRRWGSTFSIDTAAKSSSVRTYFGVLRSLFEYLTRESLVAESPLVGMVAPTVKQSQIQPLSEAQVRALMEAARKSNNAKRDIALISLLLDSAMRCNELTTLKAKDVDVAGRSVMVWGKGGKARIAHFGGTTARHLYSYLKSGDRDETVEALFQCVSPRWRHKGGLDNPGVLQLVRRLGKDAGIVGVRCSPHTLRHTAAVMFLRNGGNVFSLREILGHTNLNMTSRYVALAEADVANQHRLYSPVDGMKGK